MTSEVIDSLRRPRIGQNAVRYLLLSLSEARPAKKLSPGASATAAGLSAFFFFFFFFPFIGVDDEARPREARRGSTSLLVEEIFFPFLSLLRAYRWSGGKELYPHLVTSSRRRIPPLSFFFLPLRNGLAPSAVFSVKRSSLSHSGIAMHPPP